MSIQQRLTGALRQYRHNSDDSPGSVPREGFVVGYDKAEIDSMAAEARQIITDLVEYAEQNDPGNPHIGRAKGFLSGEGEG